MTSYTMYVDFARPLSNQERLKIFDALEVIVPNGGCVGAFNGTVDEVCFCVNAVSETEAKAITNQYMCHMLACAKLSVGFSIGYILETV